MEDETTVVQQTEQTATTAQTVTPTGTEGDAEARIAALEIERNNYKIALNKEKSKKKPELFEDEDEDDRIQRIVDQRIAQSKIAAIDAEKEAIYQKAIKENKELKLAQLNKTTTPAAALGTHNESIAVTDTKITPEQMAYFKSKGYTDKDIERYKKNLNRTVGR